ncbi:transcription elongation factor Spt6 [Metschnikowia bicuspidata var. bicuspidata NRRL YB-4993]|uniref:Transcription elongation factor Spt6 n=1 Tax=Metschnikowia bicuspidata var. bicuspidata NRRL YB-4993 TaxID=869754 RepID=A0A1A0H8F3_9ASCO|nr:transcription elongation factor Spt6 [Metschnikowia bicuspidata var. bicuspidata NRRL YB-4993]OBA20167.1 transcription elongation factor Spt6 [Metschnikowia bicuspidata var. bicuspidata NRRL YB-4993]
MPKEFEEDEIRTGGAADHDVNSSDGGDDVMDDSSEEDEDEDNDEEAIQKVRDGFIVDDDEDDDALSSKKNRRKHKKRRERERALDAGHDDGLDEDDLELLLENSGAAPRPASGSKFKRLKRASPADSERIGADDSDSTTRGPAGALNDFFSDDEAPADERADPEQEPADERNILDEFEDFIEEDEFSDEEEARAHKAQQRREQAKLKGPKLDTSKLSSVDRESLQQLFEVFGNGAEYEWALEAQEIEDEGNNNDEPTALDEVFEHAELKDRMLTEEDNMIRVIDIPERFQKYRATLNYMDLEGAELQREKSWISNILFTEKKGSLDESLRVPFVEAVGKVTEFISKNNWEVPFIWTHRRDFLIYTEEITIPEGGVRNNVHKLLFEDDLWRIVQLDIEYHSLYEKKLNTENTVMQLSVDDDLLKDVNLLESMVSVQDLQDYINFTYSAELRKLNEVKELDPLDEGDDDKKSTKKHSKYAIFERIRENVLYDAIQAFGITAKEFGENVQDQSTKNYEVPYRIHATDDPLESPEDMLGRLIEDDEILFKDPKNGLNAVRKTYAEEIFHNPKIRHEVRQVYKNFASVSVTLTEKGRNLIDGHSVYADIKYAMNRSPADLVGMPDMFLRMLEAEAKGLVIINVNTNDSEHWFQSIFNCLKSDGTSEIAELWNNEREFALNLAFKRLTNMVALNTKEDLRRECERLIAAELRARFLTKIDQAPFTPYGYDKGTKPNVLSLSFGKGDYDSAVVGAFVRDTGKVSEFFKSDNNPSRGRESEEKFAGQLKVFIEKNLRNNKPDVIVVSGFSASSKKLFDIVRNFVSNNSMYVNIDDLPEGTSPQLIPVIWGQDETARLYQNSERALVELSDKPTLVKYCVGLARYVQSPLLEYVSLGDDILSLFFYEHQKYISNDVVRDVYETVFVDIVNMVGVEINEALRDTYAAQLLQFVSGLGPRKASGLLRNITAKLGTLVTRSDLIENELSTANIFFNCSSFLNIPFDEGVTLRDSSIELLDATRIHPEDYSLARKMAADALDLDEEDMAHIEEQGGIIYQLMQEGVSKVDDLNLTAFGKELESTFGKKKYATLQSIKEELVNNYEELRRSFHVPESSEVFRMLTGETLESFTRGSITPVTINRVGKNFREENGHVKFLKVSTTSNITGTVEEGHITRKANFDQGQVIQVVVLDVNYEQFTATFSTLPEDLQKASVTKFFKDPSKWDFAAENSDKEKERAKEYAKLAKTRNVQHPLFHNFNHKQAEEYLAPQSVGDCVIRPSSRGINYLNITWKVANNLFQHLSVEEVAHNTGREYVVERKKYADLDQLIFQHVQAIAKHVNEMCRHPKFQEGALAEVHEWLESYTRANPKNSAYVFCFDHKAPGWFLLLFKVNVNTPITTWHVKTEVNGFVLKGFSYPNMMRLCNGFKQTFKSLVSDKTRSGRPGHGY